MDMQWIQVRCVCGRRQADISPDGTYKTVCPRCRRLLAVEASGGVVQVKTLRGPHFRRCERWERYDTDSN